MSLSVKEIFKTSKNFNIVNVIGKIVSFPVSILVAKILGPKDFGIIGFMSLILFWSKKINPGIFQASLREIPVLMGSGRVKRSYIIQNIGFTVELLYTIFQTFILIALFFFLDDYLKIAIVVSGFAFLSGSFFSSIRSIAFFRKEFNKVAKFDLANQFLTSLLLLTFTFFWGVIGYLSVPIFTGTIISILYIRNSKLNLSIIFNKGISFGLLKVGYILAAGTLIIWAFRTIDKTIIASLYSIEILGLLTFSLNVFLVWSRLFEDFGRVLQPILWENAIKRGFQGADRVIIYLGFFSCVTLWIIQGVFTILVNYYLIRFRDAIVFFNIVSFNVIFYSISLIPSQILNSSIVNKQAKWFRVYFMGAVLGVLIELLLFQFNVEAWILLFGTLLMNIIVSFILLNTVKGYLFKNTSDFSRFMVKLYFTITFAIVLYFANSLLFKHSDIFYSLLFYLINWFLFTIVFYRDIISKLIALIKNYKKSF